MPNRTESQRLASQQNGRLSRGPKSPAGKARTRENALKHGLTATQILPDDMRQEVEAEILIFERTLKPVGEFEQKLVHQAALASVKFLRLAQADLQRDHTRQLHATAEWDKSQEIQAAQAALALDPKFTGAPAEATALLIELDHSSAGRRLKAQAWQDLLDALDTNKAWTDTELQRVARLYGYIHSLKRDDVPEAIQELLRANETCRNTRAAQGTLPDGVACYMDLKDLVRDEIALNLEAADHIWQARELPDRDFATTRALLDATPEGHLLNRYKSDAHRIQRQTLDLLYRHRRQQRAHRRADDQAESYPSPTYHERHKSHDPQPFTMPTPVLETNPAKHPKNTFPTPPGPEHPPQRRPRRRLETDHLIT